MLILGFFDLLKTIFVLWNKRIKSLTFTWAESEWGMSTSDWIPVFSLIFVIAIVGIFLLFVLIGLIAQGKIHKLCFWVSFTMIKMMLIYSMFLSIYIFGVLPYFPKLAFVEYIIQGMPNIYFTFIIFILGSFIFGICSWFIMKLLNICCPVPNF